MNNIKNNNECNKNYGLISIMLAYTVWGIQGLYWKVLQSVPLMQILAHRIIWSAALLIPIIIVTKRTKDLVSAFITKKVFYMILCAILIGSNWLLNIYAVYSNQMVEASLGQYITPIMVISLGIFILKEKIRLHEVLALIIALIGISIVTINFGKIPFIAVLLILTFALYTFFKKTVNVDPIVGIAAEILILSPFALTYLIFSECSGNGVFFSSDIPYALLIISTGIFTAVPFIIFSYGVQLVNLSKIGFIQYYAPTLNLLIGIFIYKESFNRIHIVSFSFIWTAILIVLFYPILKKLQNVH